jgi:hypothetical protein
VVFSSRGNRLILNDSNWQHTLESGGNALLGEGHTEPTASSNEPVLWICTIVDIQISLSSSITKYLQEIGESKALMVFWLANLLPNCQKQYLLHLFDTHDFQLKITATVPHKSLKKVQSFVGLPLEEQLTALIRQERLAEALKAKEILEARAKVDKYSQLYEQQKKNDQLLAAIETKRLLEEWKLKSPNKIEEWCSEPPANHLTINAMFEKLVEIVGEQKVIPERSMIKFSG